MTNTVDLSRFSATNSIVVNKALFDNCGFINANIENTEIRNTHIDKVRQIYNWSEGALFAVAGVNISTNKIEFYKNLKDSLLACKETDLGFLYERYWCLFIMN